MDTTDAPPVPVPKTKTKAKARYLKRKKERRKLSKSKNKDKKAKERSRSGDDVEYEEDREDGEGEGREEEEEEGSVVAQVGMGDEGEQGEEEEAGEEEEEEEEIQKVERRPKKRRKVSIGPDAVEAVHHTTRTKHTETSPPIQNSPPPIPQTALPIFPLPTHPSAPSNLKTTLALQGLDRALVDAEIVPPGRTVAVKIGSDKDRMEEFQFGFGEGDEEREEWTRTGLSEKMSRRLVELGITELFAVQTCLLPFLLPRNATHKALYQPYNPPRDVCVCAPTGSGKTLAYAIPIVEILSTRITTRLRALIVLPTRDLVMQVRETFEEISKGRGLKIGTATGQHSFTHEQGQLVGDIRYSLLGGSSKLDILISTPGRLIDHLNDTPNFTLQHLRFLVIDEADRLLAQSFQDWLGSVVGTLRPPSHVFDGIGSSNLIPDALSPAFHHLLPLHHRHHPNVLYPDPTSFSPFPTEHKHASCQKLLFSATLTRDPGKIAALELRDPKYFVVQGGPAASGIDGEDEEEDVILDVVSERFTMPATLKEHMIICTTYNKPLVFFHLVHTRLKTFVQSQESQISQSQNSFSALVFTKSAESTNRLVRLFEFFQVAREKESKESKEDTGMDTTNTGGMDTMDTTVIARAYSSDLPPSERKSILEEFKAGKIQILISSDLISRGIDLPNITHVISYDTPVDIRKYVHRLGRTARAGRVGEGWTLVEEQEARHFKLMLKTANHLSHVKRVRIGEGALEGLVKSYETALGNLKEVYTHSHSRS
ncbi:P-loop containing nucleoside triphosphate hydrolase protein [Lentinula raphanica]|nr:P-loop containing nucleoside triphosphate hydrolase protein [Lentinula raphanica]